MGICDGFNEGEYGIAIRLEPGKPDVFREYLIYKDMKIKVDVRYQEIIKAHVQTH